MNQKESLFKTATVAAIVAVSSVRCGTDHTNEVDQHIFATISGIDCQFPELAPPIIFEDPPRAERRLQSAVKEAIRITLEDESSSYIASIACARADDYAIGGVTANDLVDIELGIRADSQNPNLFARAITSIVVDKPGTSDNRQVDGAFTILGEIEVTAD